MSILILTDLKRKQKQGDIMWPLAKKTDFYFILIHLAGLFWGGLMLPISVNQENRIITK